MTSSAQQTVATPRLEPDSAEELAARVREAAAAGRTVLPAGLGTRPAPVVTAPPPDILLSTARLTQVVHYEPGDLTITVQAGIGLDALDDLLAEQGQWFPHQPYRRAGTLGGLLASAADGALDLAAGRPRDAVLGARFALGDGTLAAARGRVVKNVTGYDVPRLLVGSRGTLGVLVEVSLKLQPRPPAQGLLAADFDRGENALATAQALLSQPWEPVLVDVLCGSDASAARLLAGFDGSEARVAGLLERTEALVASAGAARCEILEAASSTAARARLDDPQRSLGAGVPAAATATLRFSGLPTSVPAAVAALLEPARAAGLRATLDARPGLGLVFAALQGNDAAALRRAVDAASLACRRLGALVWLAAPQGWQASADEVWGAPPRDFALLRRIKQALDPGGVLAAGRFVGGL